MHTELLMIVMGAALVASLMGMTTNAAAQPSDDAWPAELPAHPRLLAKAADWAAMKRRRASDAEFAEVCKGLLVSADAVLSLPAMTREMEGIRLLHVSRELIRRVVLCAWAYQMTGDAKYLKRAERDMLDVSGFSDWNPSHFLDVAEMTAGLAIGYDWLHDDLSDTTRATIRQAMIDKGLIPSKEPRWWQSSNNNWNQVCWAGAVMGALAIYEHEPELAQSLLAEARVKIANGLKPYAPDGIYPEGSTYWSYGTSFQVLLIASVQSALGTDWDMLKSAGLGDSVQFISHAEGPTGLVFNFGDCGFRRSPDAAFFFLAEQTSQPVPLRPEMQASLDRLKRGDKHDRLFPLITLWWPSANDSAKQNEMSTHWSGQGECPVAMWRSAWNDADAFYFAIKGGGGCLNHADLDAGTFVLDDAGRRWASDLGFQSYHDLEKRGIGLFNRAQDSDRWRIFRRTSESHNIITIDGKLLRSAGLAKLIKADATSAKIDTTDVYLEGQLTRARRLVNVQADKHTVTLTDELEGLTPGSKIRWAMATAAKVTTDGTTATLEQNGKQLNVHFAAHEPTLAVQDISHPEGDHNEPNPGMSLLTATVVAGSDGKVKIVTTMGRR